MKRLLLAGAAFAALIAGPAMAADQAPKVYRRPVVVAAPVYSWTGFYVGGNLGYSWGNASTNIVGSGTTFILPGLLGFFPSFPGFPANLGFAGSNTTRLNGMVGGGQIGYNFQFTPKWVLGFETDIQGAGERGSSTFVNPFSTQLCGNNIGLTCIANVPANGIAGTAYEARINWFGTVRGRLGYLITDQVLLYGTGGLAYGQVKLSGITGVNGSTDFTSVFPTVTPFTPGGSVFSASKTNVGFTVGGGIEGKCSYWLPAGWTWKLEYLYVDLGSLDTVTSFPSAVPQFGLLLPGFTYATPFTGSIATHTHFTDNVVRVGLNYKFGYALALVTK
jgi:outer membrane immunogenic protein